MNQPRDQWTSRLGFILAASGSAIGLGNLWKFPYITYHNNGGAFVLVYLVCIVLVGLPIMVSEILLGRRTQLSPVGALRVMLGPAWSWVGRLGVLTGFVILGYYAVVAGWSLQYFISCLKWSISGYEIGASGNLFGTFVSNGPTQVTLAGIFLLATLLVVVNGVGKGIEKVARGLLPLLLAILLLLLASALTMKGAGAALKFIFVPDFGQLRAESVLEALGHAFFTLSLGMGAMITYGSYMRKTDSVPSSAMAVVILDTVIALMATVIMFSVIFSVDGLRDTVGKSTVGMLFITLPEQFFVSVPMGRVLAPLFYILVAFAALTSTISLMEVIVSYFIDEHGVDRRRATWMVGAACFALSFFCALSFGAFGGFSNFEIFKGKPGIFSTLDHLAANWFLPIGGFLTTVAVGWFVSRDTLKEELVDANTPAWFSFGVWRFFTRFVAPVAVGAIIVAVIFAGRDFS